VKTIGLDQIMFDLIERLIEFIRNDYLDSPFLAVIKGEVGSGKTTFALNLVEEIQSSKDFKIL
jgi:pantothenate kinase-related protein Tda10